MLGPHLINACKFAAQRELHAACTQSLNGQGHICNTVSAHCSSASNGGAMETSLTAEENSGTSVSMARVARDYQSVQQGSVKKFQ